MILNYMLDEEEFEYRIDFFQFKEFIISSLSKKEILDFVVNVWNNLENSSQEKEETTATWGIHTDKDWEDLIEEDFDLVLDFVVDHEKEFVEIYEDGLLDYFRDEAMEHEQDSRELEKDPYSYYGVRRDDFF